MRVKVPSNRKHGTQVLPCLVRKVHLDSYINLQLLIAEL